MCLIHFEALGLYIYASTESIMKNVPYTKIETNHGDIIKIDSNDFLSRSEFEDTNYRFTPWYRYSYYDFEDDYYPQYEQLLFDICNTFGVDEDDVALLLDFGYTPDEIEDMMMDYDLLHSTIQNIKCDDYYDDFLTEV